MSEFHVVVVELGEVLPHENADSLEITQVHGGYPCIVRKGEYKEGDKAVYVPIDSICPTDNPIFAFLGKHNRIKAKKLRGVFSMGLLVAAPEGVQVGDNLQELLGITKYDPEAVQHGKSRFGGSFLSGKMESDPGFFPIYTDIESIRKWKRVFEDGERVVLTEKIHGANGRFLWRNDRLWVGSHRTFKKRPEDDVPLGKEDLWWKMALKHDLEAKLATYPNIGIYGEVYGQVQDLKYDHPQGEYSLRLFDAMDTTTNRYLDYEDFLKLALELEVETAPLLYSGPWSLDLMAMAEGQSTIANNVREGWVARPVKERWHERLGRVVLKCVGEGYLLR